MSFEYCSVCWSMCGRGPTMDMSPLSTLMNWGSSSMLDRRRKSPNRVLRGSSLVACTLSASALTRIERNLMHLNVWPFSPLRSCRKSTGPREVSLVPMATKI